MALRQWLSRALAFCRCACSIDRAARPASRFAADWPNPNPSTNAPAAVRTWHTVRPAFFPPKLPADLCQHQVAHRTDDLVPFQPQIAPTFPVVKAQFCLGVLEAALHMPPREPDQEQEIGGRFGRRVAHELFD